MTTKSPEETPLQWQFLRDCRIRMNEWLCAYSNTRVNELSAMGIRIGFITSCRHSNTLYAGYSDDFMQLPSEKKMLVCSFRKYSLSITALRTCFALYELIRKARATTISKL